MFDLTGKTALVTGARRGIGAAIAAGLAEPGRTLVLHHLAAPGEAEAVARRCRERGADAVTLEADLRDPAAVRRLPVEEWQETFAVNVTAPMLLAQALGPGMAERGRGRIVNVVSVTVRLGGPSGPAYVSSKAALIGLTRSLAQAWGPAGITVNALSPGAVRTEGEVELAGRDDDDLHAPIIARQAIPRQLVPDDLVATVRFLVSDGASAMTGQVLEVGGGLVYR